MARPVQWISSTEAAARLGVKPQTLYAYASRGLVQPRRAVDGRTSRYDARQIDELARRGRPGGRPARAGSVDVRITTAVTELTAAGPSYRGRLAADLAGAVPFEAVAQWLWTGDEATWRTVRAVEWAARLPAEPGPGAPTIEAVIARCVVASGADPARADRRPEAVHAAARRLIGELVAGLPARARRPRPEGVAATLFARLAGRPPTDAERTVIDGALVLLADHDIAASTLAARVAASTRADVYHVVLAGLATLSGPLHGSASSQAYTFLRRVGAHGDAFAAVDDVLALGERLPGFGHRIYRTDDPRFGALVGLVRAAEVRPERIEAVDGVVLAAADRVGTFPNIDLALAAMAWAFDLPPTAGECVMSIARVAGWVAHALEEYGERPLRYRPMAAYVGPRSSAPPARS